MTFPASESPTLRKQDWAYTQLREWIIEGSLADPIDETSLATKLQVSRIPLRHALSRLASEGMVIDRPHRRLLVTPLSLADAEDVYAGRIALEVLLAERATSVATADDIEKVRAALQVQLDHTEQEDFSVSRTDDRNFHFTMYASAGYANTFSLYQRLRVLSERYIHLYLKDPARLRESSRQHQEIFDAFAAGESARAGELTRRHVSEGIEVLRTMLG
jgi:DNA-binding GntR family transcriptional regulator